MFKVKNKIAPILIQELHPSHENTYNLRNQRCWQTFNVRTVCYGNETLLFRGQKRGNFTLHRSKIQIPCLNSKARLENGTQKVVHVGYVKLLYTI